jgi:mono/diheme cytochrome c family protein
LPAPTPNYGAVAAPFPLPPSLPPRGESLVLELGCIQCHSDLAGQSSIREQAPELSQAGLRYRTAYLFEFLQRPKQVRRHIGRARMPDFQLTEKEALALALFLETQQATRPTGQPPWPEPIQEQSDAPPRTVTKAEFERELSNGLVCLSCHSLEGQGGALAPEFTEAGHQLRPGWITTYLVAPSHFGVAPNVMPPQFFQLSEDGTRYEKLVANPEQRIATIVGYLNTVGAPRATEQSRILARAKSTHPNVTAAQGEQLFRALNCAACHRHERISPRQQAAPALANEGLRVQRTWLESFLRKPSAVRPTGYYPGDASRMPDFHLQNVEAIALANFLASLRQATTSTMRRPAPAYTNEVRASNNRERPTNTPPSAFAQDKARLLLSQKLSCLGCHRLDGKGGMLGPELNTVPVRLQPEYVYAIISDPARWAPHSIMPKILLPAGTVDLLARYLIFRNAPGTSNATYLSPLEARLTFPDSLPTLGSPTTTSVPTPAAQANYLRYCAPCHGLEGRGDGFNAPFLPAVVPGPTPLANAAYLAQRPDDTLFDGIHSGGAILNRSHFMPPWGATLSADEIRALVKHLRELCQCEGPAWSRDGNTNAPVRAERRAPN